MTAFAYVGGYTSRERDGRGDGLNVYRIDAGSGAWTHAQRLSELANPSWLTLGPAGRVLYVAHGDGNAAAAYAVDPASGLLRPLGHRATGGGNGVRLGLDGSGRFLVCANYGTGTVAVLPIESDGALGPVTDLVPLQGTAGPHRTQQTSAHPHDIAFDPSGRFFLVPDKGLDRVFVFRVDGAAARWSRARRRRWSPVAARARATPPSTPRGPTPTCSTSSTRLSPPIASTPGPAPSPRGRW